MEPATIPAIGGGVAARKRALLSPAPKGLSFEALVRELHVVFASDVVNVERVADLMAAYASHPPDWRKFARFDRYRYTRNLVDEGNGKFNLMILCWGEGHGSAIHDHANAHCFMKVLEGSLRETRFEWPEEGSEGLEKKGSSDICLNEVCYINDTMGLHRVENASNTAPAVSLHLYCPPFDTCSVFNERTGQRSACKVTFWSKYGQKPKVRVDAPPEDN